MPNLNGIEAIAQLRKDNSKVKVVLLTMHDDPVYARRALDAGANGFVVKQSAASELIMAIKVVLKGQTFISPVLTGDLLKHPLPQADVAGETLTPRQRDVLRLLAEGLSAKQIAVRLTISPRTVEYHKHQMMESHGLHSSAELIHFAIKKGIVVL
jgi:DNA-binding NarL/FixJ family response regulator